jgi:hypothetical protein
MDNEKSFLDKITDTVKDIATLASDAASHALKSEEPPLKADETAVAYMPLAADGLVSDPMMVAPIAGPSMRKKRVAKRRVAKKAAKKVAKKPAKKSVKKSAKKAAKKSTARKSKKAAKKTGKKTVKKTAKKATKKKTAAKKTRKAKRGR